MNKIFYNLVSGYHQIVLQDDASFASPGPDIIWGEEDLIAMVWAQPRFLLISTARVDSANVILSVLESKPELDYAEWDQITECCIDIPSGVLRVSGLFDYFPDSPFLTVDKQLYGVFLCFAGLGTVSKDKFDGEDSCHIFVWKSDINAGPKIIKKWSESGH